MTGPDLGLLLPAVSAARDEILKRLDAAIAKAPTAEAKAGLQALRDELANDLQLPADIAAQVFSAFAAALKSGDFGPATSSDSDLA